MSQRRRKSHQKMENVGEAKFYVNMEIRKAGEAKIAEISIKHENGKRRK